MPNARPTPARIVMLAPPWFLCIVLPASHRCNSWVALGSAILDSIHPLDGGYYVTDRASFSSTRLGFGSTITSPSGKTSVGTDR